MTWQKGTIYCSAFTKLILLRTRPYLESDNIIVLLPGKPRIINSVNVLMYPANHMAGSAMFHFNTNKLSVFCTCDYRYTPQLHLPPRGTRIHVLYIDATFQSVKVPLLSTETSAALAHDWISYMSTASEETPLFLGFCHFGSCELFYALHRTYGYTFHFRRGKLPQERYNIAKLIHPEMWDETSRLIVVPSRINPKELPTPILLPSANWHAFVEGNQALVDCISEDHNGQYRLNFTNHSDAFDNAAVVKRLKPDITHYVG